MRSQDVIDFFDRLAPGWDADMIRDEERIVRILNYAQIGRGVRVLDVACGTGVLVPDYLAREVAGVTGVDISPAMIARAREKFSDPRVTLIAADIEKMHFEPVFDRCVVYNAFPHFPQPARLIGRLSSFLSPGGRLTVAHGMSRAAINTHHAGSASKVSIGLMEADALKTLFAPHFHVDVAISEDIYVVSGTKRRAF